MAMRFPAKITSFCIWVAIPVDLLIELFYIGLLVVRTDGRSGGRSVGVRARAPLKFLTRIVKDVVSYGIILTADILTI